MAKKSRNRRINRVVGIGEMLAKGFQNFIKTMKKWSCFSVEEEEDIVSTIYEDIEMVEKASEADTTEIAPRRYTAESLVTSDDNIFVISLSLKDDQKETRPIKTVKEIFVTPALSMNESGDDNISILELSTENGPKEAESETNTGKLLATPSAEVMNTENSDMCVLNTTESNTSKEIRPKRTNRMIFVAPLVVLNDDDESDISVLELPIVFNTANSDISVLNLTEANKPKEIRPKPTNRMIFVDPLADTNDDDESDISVLELPIEDEPKKKLCTNHARSSASEMKQKQRRGSTNKVATWGAGETSECPERSDKFIDNDICEKNVGMGEILVKAPRSPLVDVYISNAIGNFVSGRPLF